MVSTISGLASVVMSPGLVKLEMPAITRRIIFPDRVFGMQRAVTREVRPVAPVLAVLLLVVFGVVGRHESVWIAVDGLENARPRVADADVAGLGAAFGHRLAMLVEDHGIDAQYARAAAARLHRLQRRQSTAQKAAVLGLPPAVHNRGLSLPDFPLVHTPNFRLDRLPPGGHGLAP